MVYGAAYVMIEVAVMLVHAAVQHFGKKIWAVCIVMHAPTCNTSR
jgi:hypothetical protein